MSVGVMTSPLTIAVALMTDGIALPNIWAFSGNFSDWALLPALGSAGCVPSWPESCAIAPLARANAAAPAAIHRRTFVTPKAAATIKFSLFPNVCHAASPLNAGLAAHTFQRQVNGEGAPLAEGPDALIVAAPGHAKLQAIILIFDADAVADRLPTVAQRKRVLGLVGEIDDAGAEYRPIAVEQDPSRDAQLLPIAQILDRRVDVAVELEIADLSVGLRRADGEVDLVSADREIILVDPVAVGDVDEAAVADARASDDVRYAACQSRSFGEQ